MGLKFYVLCEDRAHEQFLRGLLEGKGLVTNWAREVRSTVAPKGQGAASQFVKQQFPEVVRVRRSKAFQQGLAVITMVDGDNIGGGRARELLSSLQPERGASERVAVLVPTWSIETWVLALCGEVVDEATSHKSLAPDEKGLRMAAEQWEPARPNEPLQMAEARTELRRI
jgi:hypothetical protein